MPDVQTINISTDHRFPVGLQGYTTTVTVLVGDTVYYGGQQVSASQNTGSLTAGQSTVVTVPQVWLLSNSNSVVQVSNSVTTSAATSIVPYGLPFGDGGVPIGLRGGAAFEAITDAVQTQGMYRFFMPLADPNAGEIRPVFGNWFGGTSGVASPFFYDGDAANAISFAAAVETSDGQVLPFVFAGTHLYTLNAGNPIVKADYYQAFGLQVTDPTTGFKGCWMRTWITVTAAQTWPLNLGLLASGDAFRSGTGALSDLTLAGSGAVSAGTGQSTAFGPIAVYGRGHARKPNGILVGDSIMRGQTNNHVYWSPMQQVGAQLGINVQVLAKGGETLSEMGTPAAHRYRAALAEGGTHAIVSGGTNDGSLNNAGGVTTMQTRAIAVGTWLNSVGISDVTLQTIPPRTSSTDSWATVVNQTPTAGAQVAPLASYNAWVNTTPFPYTRSSDIAAICNSTPGSGLWLAGSLTGDGVHPGLVLMAAITAGPVTSTMSAWPSTV
jgi:hypothetical protein